MATGLARITVSTPNRRLDVALPDQAPVAELLPELLRHAGQGPVGEASGGWVLRRTDGACLSPVRGLAAQGIVDGAVLHLAPASLDWPRPDYDDVAEAVAAGIRGRGPQWSPVATRTGLHLLAAVLLAGGLLAVIVRAGAVSPVVPAGIAGAALLTAILATRQDGWWQTGALLGAAALLYAFVAGAQWAPGGSPPLGGASALLAAALLGVVVAGGRAWFVAGATAGLLGVPAALAGQVVGSAGAAAALACVLVCGVGVLPMAAMRLGGLPVPPVGAGRSSPGTLAREVASSAVARADEMLTGALAGWSVLAAAVIGVLLVSGGAAGQVLAALTATALALRARLFVAVRHRLPLLAGGLMGYALLAAALLAVAPPDLLAVVIAVAAGVALLLAGGAGRSGPVASPWTGRIADTVDTLAIVVVVPVAAAVLDLYALVLAAVTST